MFVKCICFKGLISKLDVYNSNVSIYIKCIYSSCRGSSVKITEDFTNETWQASRQYGDTYIYTHQWSRIEIPEIIPHIYVEITLARLLK